MSGTRCGAAETPHDNIPQRRRSAAAGPVAAEQPRIPFGPRSWSFSSSRKSIWSLALLRARVIVAERKGTHSDRHGSKVRATRAGAL